MTSRYPHPSFHYGRDQAPYITSDTHFGHTNIIQFMERPFEDAEAMDRNFIESWNLAVPKDAVIWHLGDFGRHHGAELIGLLKKLNGHKHLILGNHDRPKWGFSDSVLDQFAWVGHYAEITVDHQHVVLSHYPFESWNRAYHGTWHFHGFQEANGTPFTCTLLKHLQGLMSC